MNRQITLQDVFPPNSEEWKNLLLDLVEECYNNSSEKPTIPDGMDLYLYFKIQASILNASQYGHAILAIDEKSKERIIAIAKAMGLGDQVHVIVPEPGLAGNSADQIIIDEV